MATEFARSMEPVTVRALDLTMTRMIEDRELRTCKEAMAYLRVSRSTIYRFMYSGQLKGHKVGNSWRFYQQDLDGMIKSGGAR